MRLLNFIIKLIEKVFKAFEENELRNKPMSDAFNQELIDCSGFDHAEILNGKRFI